MELGGCHPSFNFRFSIKYILRRVTAFCHVLRFTDRLYIICIYLYAVDVHHLILYLIHFDKRGTKCQFGHPELFIPTESATDELEFDVSFNTA